MDADRLYLLVGAHIQRERTARGMKQVELAERLGLKRTSVANIEAGRQRPSLHQIFLIAAALECEAEALLPPMATVKAQSPMEAGTVLWSQALATLDPHSRRTVEAVAERLLARHMDTPHE